MSIATPPITNFTAGELSTRLDGRVDLSKYFNGCRTLENFHVHPHGGATKRSGFRKVVAAGSDDNESYLLEFEYNVEQAYCLEFYENADGDGKARVFYDGGLVLSGASPYEFDIPWASSDWTDLTYVQSNDTLFLVHPSFQPRKITRTGHTAWTVTEHEIAGQPEEWDTDNWPGVVAFYQDRLIYGSTPSQPNKIWFSQTGNYDDFRLRTREAPIEESWDETAVSGTGYGKSTETFTLLDGLWFEDQFVVRGKDPNNSNAAAYFRYIGDRTYQASGSDVTMTFKDAPSAATEVESVHVSNAGEWIQDYLSWELISPGDRVAVVGLDPLTDDAFDLPLSARRGNAIEWLAPKDKLYIGTRGGEWVVGPLSTGEALGPGAYIAALQSSQGSLGARPVETKSGVIYIQRSGKKIREMVYQFETDSYASQDLTILSEHITGNGVSQLAYAQEPDSRVYAVRDDGVLLALTYLREQEEIAWSRLVTSGEVESVAAIYEDSIKEDRVYACIKRTIGGEAKRFIEYLEVDFDAQATTAVDYFGVDCGATYDGRNEEISYEFTLTGGGTWAAGSSATVTATSHAPFTSGSVGNIYGLQVGSNSAYSLEAADYRFQLAAFLTSNSGTVTLLNAIPANLQSNATANWAQYASSVTGLDYLEGEEVAILADGAVQPNATVADGRVTLSPRARVAHIGLPFSATLQPSRVEAGSQRGTAQTKRKFIASMAVRFRSTVGGKIGPDADHLDIVPFRSGADAMGRAVPVFNGDKIVLFPSGWDREGILTVVQDQPLPMTVIMIVPKMAINE